MCVCERERERERKGMDNQLYDFNWDILNHVSRVSQLSNAYDTPIWHCFNVCTRMMQ